MIIMPSTRFKVQVFELQHSNNTISKYLFTKA